MTPVRVIVVGGGLAGITAALDCAAAGAAVTLLESRGRLGGQAYSFVRDGVAADNGQHVFLRCCTGYRSLVERIGAADMVTLQDRLDIAVLGRDGLRGRLNRTDLPVPLHLAGALLRYRLLSVRERLSAARAMGALTRLDVADPATDAVTFGAWLARRGQGARACAALWDLIVRPTVNLPAAEASLAQAAYVFQEGLLSGRAAGDLGHARVPLSEIHDVRAREALARAGVEVRLRSGVGAIEPGAGASGFTVRLASPGVGAGEDSTSGSGSGSGSGSDTAELTADAVVLATGPERTARLLPPAAGVDPDALRALGESPIVNVHLVYDRPVLDVAFAAGVDTPVQWVFDRTRSAGVRDGQYLVVTLSAARAELEMSSEAILARYQDALRELLPAARDAQVVRAFVTRDHAATFRAAPGQRVLRPAARTALPGFALAGAHTDTGWPATMEGAVRSGRAAAAVVLEATAAPEPRVPAPSGGRPRPARGARRMSRLARAGQPDATGDAGLVVLTPLSIEARAVRAGAPWARVQRVGMGRRRAARWAAAGHGLATARAVLVAGFCGALDPSLQPGDVVLASELRGPDGAPIATADPAILAGVLRRGGMRVHVGPVACSEKIVRGERRRELARSGALAVDMESAWLAPASGDRPFITLRVVLDTGARELHRPVQTLSGSATAYRALKRASALTEEWVRALGPRDVVLASPRASCAGVDRAIAIVQAALADRGAPVYVRKQIVHNGHVVSALEDQGAVFVEELDEVPRGATVVFSAHGVSPEVRRVAGERGLAVIDATCPLVSKVHAEARRFARDGFDIVLVGHDGHEEVEGTYGEAPERTHVIATAEQVAGLRVDDPTRVAYLTQTTLAVDETTDVVAALRDRFPSAVGPPSADICYATQNRQDAVRGLADDSDLVLVVGSSNSSNSRRLVEVAQRAGSRALLVDEASQIPPAALEGVARVGVTAGASAPEALVQGVVSAVAGLGAVRVSEYRVATENMHFKLPPQVRQQRSR